MPRLREIIPTRTSKEESIFTRHTEERYLWRMFRDCRRDLERAIRDITASTSIPEAHVRKMNRENSLLPADIIILRIPCIRRMRAICRRCSAIMERHGWRCIQGGFIRRTLLGIRLSYMRRRMIFGHSLRGMQAR